MTKNLQNALGCFIEDEGLAQKLSLALITAAGKTWISYEEIASQSPEDTEDVLLSAFEWRLLLPTRAVKCMEWDDRLLLAEPGENYELPNVVKWLVTRAVETGKWNPSYALADLFQTMKDPDWKQIPPLVECLLKKARNHKISAVKITECCRERGLTGKVDSLIAELKGSGVMSPRLGSLADMAHAREGPVYELNPCLAHRSN